MISQEHLIKQDDKVILADSIQVLFPEVSNEEIPQDEEFCIVEIGEERKRIRFHDYGKIYSIPGLYEKIFYERLECQSPSLLGNLLMHEVERCGIDPQSMEVLDVGAGNGIMGEVLAESGVESMVGVDLLPEAAQAVERDRPELYDQYFSVDLLNPPIQVEQALEQREFNCLTMIAALGFGDIPTPVFGTAYNLIEPGGFVVFNIKEDFLKEGDPTGFAALVREMIDCGWMERLMSINYVHRLSITGDPIYYNGIIGRKLADLPGEYLEL